MLSLLTLSALLALLLPAPGAQGQRPSAPPVGAAPAAPATPFPSRVLPTLPAAPLIPGAGAGQGSGYGAAAHNLVFATTIGDTRVDLAFRDTPIRDALKQVLEQAKQEWALERDVPSDRRVTLCAARVRLSTALDTLAEAAGVGWSVQPRYDAATRTFCTLIRIGGSPPPSLLLDGSPGGVGGVGGVSLSQLTGLNFGPGAIAITGGPLPPAPGMAGVLAPGAPATPPALLGDRITFTCRHCHAQISTIRPRVQPLCPRCGRRFHADWQFCPHDGAKRPPAPGEWRFCPVCGKPVDSDHADVGDPDAEQPAEQIERTGQPRPDDSPRKSDWNDAAG